MNQPLMGVLLLGAVVFIAVSASMNALFLSSFARTGLEGALLIAISMACDVLKAVLPVVIARSVALRAWRDVVAASILLVVVGVLSLASGFGFVAVTRETAAQSGEAAARSHAELRRRIAALDTQLASLTEARPAAVIEAELARLQLDRRWGASQSCTELTTAVLRSYCTSIADMRVALSSARERDRLTAERGGALAQLNTEQSLGRPAIEDAQSANLAAMLQVDAHVPRRVLTFWIAMVVELGSVVLLLLVAGQSGQRRNIGVTEPAHIPMQADRGYWQRKTRIDMMNSN